MSMDLVVNNLYIGDINTATNFNLLKKYVFLLGNNPYFIFRSHIKFFPKCLLI